MKYSCFTLDSIKLMAEGACLPEPSSDVAAIISEDVTFRLRLIISRAAKLMQHANRTKLTCADINRALKWSDCQPVFGHECNSNNRPRYCYSVEAQVFVYQEDEIDLVARHKVKQAGKTVLDESYRHENLPELRIETLA